MSGDFTGAGEVATGALIGRAVEPRAGEDAHAPTSLACRNCGTRLTGQFCHACGQNGHIHKTMAAIGHDILHGVLHLEGKTWRTLPMLAFKPGQLTRRYIAGERARFVSPMAVFLFSVFLMFAVVAQLPGWNLTDNDMLKPGVAEGIAQARTKLAEEKARAEQDIADERRLLARERADREPDPDRIARLEGRLATAIKGRTELARAEQMIGPGTVPVTIPKAPTGGNWFEQKWEHAKANPELLLYKVKTSAYKFSWAMIPISLPFIWLLFPLRRDVGMYDHAIFATYSLSFMSLLVIVLAVLAAVGVPLQAVWFAALLIPPFHIYKQLKYGYGLGRAGALWRTFLMLNFAVFTVVTFVILLVWLGLAE